MAQRLIQSQEQKLQQVQRLSQQQMLQVRLLEMPLAELEENINAEIDDNPALEALPHEDTAAPVAETGDYHDDSDTAEADFDTVQERQDRDDALNAALENIGRDDEMPALYNREESNGAEYEERVYGDTTSFYDKLKEQMGETELDAKSREVMEYIIGSLDDDGLLRKDSESISDELTIYYNIDVTPEEVDRVIAILQTFDPPGIGAHSLQECLMLQIDRRPDSEMKRLMREVVENHFDEFTKKHWNKIQSALGTADYPTRRLQDELRRLNPKPGASLGETQGSTLQQITPDFIVDTSDTGDITFTLNTGNVPELKVSQSFADLVETYRNNKEGMTRRDKEALLYAKEKVSRAQGFIEAVRQRQHTLRVTMQAIIDWQRKFFTDGDEADLRPMILKNIADKTGLDISTISRVSNVKYVQTNWGTFPLRFFFTDGYTTDNGEEMSTRKIKMALKDIIAKEDKKKPKSDDVITREMAALGYPIARRTVAKYREQMGIPVARLRK